MSIRAVIVSFAAVSLLVVALIGLRTGSALAQAPAAQVCTMPDSGSYSAGALAKRGDDVYRCVHVFGDKLTPSGVAWVKGRMKGNDFVPVEPADAR